MAEKKITFPSLMGSWEMAKEKFGVEGTPSNFIIDPEGRVLFTHVGFRGEEGIQQMEREIEAIFSRPERTHGNVTE